MTNFSLNAFSCFSREKMEEAITLREQKNTKLILRYMQRLLIGKTLQATDTPNFKMAALQAEAWKEEFLTKRNTAGLKLPEPSEKEEKRDTITITDQSVRCLMPEIQVYLNRGRVLPHTRE